MPKVEAKRAKHYHLPKKWAYPRRTECDFKTCLCFGPDPLGQPTRHLSSACRACFRMPCPLIREVSFVRVGALVVDSAVSSRASRAPARRRGINAKRLDFPCPTGANRFALIPRLRKSAQYLAREKIDGSDQGEFVGCGYFRTKIISSATACPYQRPRATKRTGYRSPRRPALPAQAGVVTLPAARAQRRSSQALRCACRFRRACAPFPSSFPSSACPPFVAPQTAARAWFPSPR